MKSFYSAAVLVIALLCSVIFASAYAHAGGDPLSNLGITLAVFALVHSLGSPGTAGSPMLGISLPIAYSKTKASAIADTPLTEQQLWAKVLFLNEEMMYDENPFVDGMTGTDRDQGKAILEVVDTTKVHGTKVNIPLMSGLGGEGVFGDGIRTGSGMVYSFGNHQITVGRLWFEVGWTVTVESETMQGGVLKVRANKDIAAVMARKRCNDMLLTVRKAAYSTIGAPNLLLPSGRASKDAIRTTDTLGVAIINSTVEQLPPLGANPMNITKDGAGTAGSPKYHYMCLAQSVACASLELDPLYVNRAVNADLRGRLNASFTGELLEVNGTPVYRWYTKNPKVRDAIGNAMFPIAQLGLAITGATTGTLVKGGNTLYSASETAASGTAGSPQAPQWFKYFPGSPYLMWNGVTYAATTNQEYIAIVNPNGTYGVFPYTANDGNTITLSGGQVTGITAPGGQAQTTNFVQGARIYWCNAIGTYLCWSLFYGQNMLSSGVGSLNGGDGMDAQMSRLKEGEDDHGSRKWMGSDAVWGCNVVNDFTGAYTGFLLLLHAVTPAGAPILN